MASKLKQLWWLMLIFAVCNVVMAVMLYQSSSPEPVNEDVVPVAAKNVYSIGILQSDDLAEQNKMTAGVLAALHGSEVVSMAMVTPLACHAALTTGSAVWCG